MEQDADSNDVPPMSRLFVICGKSTTEEMLRERFSEFGEIQKIWIVKEKGSNESKGVAFVKYSKTTEAAYALEEMNGVVMNENERPIRVFVALSKNSSITNSGNEDRYLRLFIVVDKSATKEDIIDEFKTYGEIEYVIIVKNKQTQESKGVAYVKYKKFIDSATAFESCPSHYKAVFANPRPSQDEDNSSANDRPMKKMKRDSFNHNNGMDVDPLPNDIAKFFKMKNDSIPTSVDIICSKNLNQNQLWRLLDIVPGLDYCQIVEECGPMNQKVAAMYTNPESAHHAKEKLHGLEYPLGERLIVRLSSQSNSFSGPVDNNHSSDNSFYCNVNLPPTQPIVDSSTPVAARLFIVLSGGVPTPILKNVFCTFGSLIDVYLLNKKNCGYVKYASKDSADAAIKTLNDAVIFGAKIKVMVADDPKKTSN